MKKFLLFAATFLMAVVVASPASALYFDLAGPRDDGSGSSVNFSNINTWGYGIADPEATLNPGIDGIGFELDPGESYTLDFFDVTVGGIVGGGSADISATLAFDVPGGTSGTGGGEGSWFTFLGFLSGGGVHWTQQPEEVVISSTESFRIVFSDIEAFGFGNTATVQATVTAAGGVARGVAPVPEPASMVLMGIGLVGLASFGRRKLKP